MRSAVDCLANLLRRAWNGEFVCRARLRHLLPPLGLGVLAATLMFWKLGEGSLFNWDEATYAQVAREMVWTKDLFTLHRNGVLFLEKPPLYIWLTVMAYKVFGVNEFAARLWAAVSGVGTVLGTYFIGARLYSRRVGLAAGVLLLGVSNLAYSHGYNFVSLSRIGQMDIPLTFAIVVATYLGWLGLDRPKYLVWMGVPVGVGLMTKSVVALFPWVVVALVSLLCRGRRGLERWQLWAGLALALGIALPWHAGQVALHGREFLDEYVGKHLLRRAAQPLETEYHRQSVTYYLDIIRKGFPFWCWLMIPAGVHFAYRLLRERDRSALLIMASILLPLVAFSLVQTKIGWYVVIVYPALALMVASFVVKVLGRRYGLLFVLIAMLALNPRLPSPRDGSARQKHVASAIPYLAGPEDLILSYEGMNDHVMPADLFYAERLVTIVDGGEEDLRDRLAQLGTESAFVLTTTNTWHEGLPGEVVRQSGPQLLVSVRAESGASR